MFFFMQKLLEFSMALDMSRNRFLRILGKVTGVIPVRYAQRMERRLKSGKWKPAFARKRSVKDRQRIKKKRHSTGKQKKAPG